MTYRRRQAKAAQDVGTDAAHARRWTRRAFHPAMRGASLGPAPLPARALLALLATLCVCVGALSTAMVLPAQAHAEEEANPCLEGNEDPVDFGDHAPGSQTFKRLTITITCIPEGEIEIEGEKFHPGNGPLTKRGGGVDSCEDKKFWEQGQTCEIELAFEPTEENEYIAFMLVEYNRGTYTVGLVGDSMISFRPHPDAFEGEATTASQLLATSAGEEVECGGTTIGGEVTGRQSAEVTVKLSECKGPSGSTCQSVSPEAGTIGEVVLPLAAKLGLIDGSEAKAGLSLSAPGGGEIVEVSCEVLGLSATVRLRGSVICPIGPVNAPTTSLTIECRASEPGVQQYAAFEGESEGTHVLEAESSGLLSFEWEPISLETTLLVHTAEEGEVKA